MSEWATANLLKILRDHALLHFRSHRGLHSLPSRLGQLKSFGGDRGLRQGRIALLKRDETKCDEVDLRKWERGDVRLVCGGIIR